MSFTWILFTNNNIIHLYKLISGDDLFNFGKCSFKRVLTCFDFNHL